ncbi:YopX family protein [Enterococcus avium]|uniref:YopX family protein n=1 Tax=Enterococcus avium TaxID=33945 RepID=UPI0032E4CD70
MIPKFRAWDKYHEIMVIIISIDFENKIAYVEQENGDRYDIHFDNLNFMQSTGLKDKNGVEIFEGDIVLEDGMQRTVSFGEQEYEEDFGNLAYYVGFNVYTKWGYSSIDPVEYEILGNIYENPELLEAIE